MRHFGPRGEKEHGLDGGEERRGLEENASSRGRRQAEEERRERMVVGESGLKERESGGLDEGGSVFAVLE